MTRRSKVGMWCWFHSTLYPLLPLVPSWRHHYCQVIQLQHSFVLIFMHCSTGRGLVVPWFSWLTASIAAVVGQRPNVVGLWQSLPHFTTWPRWRRVGVPVIDSNYKVNCTSTTSSAPHSVFTVRGTKVMTMYCTGWLIETQINHAILKVIIIKSSIYNNIEHWSCKPSHFRSWIQLNLAFLAFLWIG